MESGLLTQKHLNLKKTIKISNILDAPITIKDDPIKAISYLY
jgi:hypothetical protein